MLLVEFGYSRRKSLSIESIGARFFNKIHQIKYYILTIFVNKNSVHFNKNAERMEKEPQLNIGVEGKMLEMFIKLKFFTYASPT